MRAQSSGSIRHDGVAALIPCPKEERTTATARVVGSVRSGKGDVVRRAFHIVEAGACAIGELLFGNGFVPRRIPVYFEFEARGVLLGNSLSPAGARE